MESLIHFLGHVEVMFQGWPCLCGPSLQNGVLTLVTVALKQINGVTGKLLSGLSDEALRAECERRGWEVTP